jgi:ParB family chromosome partitioning protein
MPRLALKRAAAPSAPGDPAAFLIPLAQIRESSLNPRKKLTRVDELAASIQRYGLLQPVVVRRIGDEFELIAGHRRLAGVAGLGWETIPAVIRDADQNESYLLTLIENLQRNDLSAKEQSEALEVLVRERGWTTREVAEAVNRSAAYVSKRLRVFEDEILAPLVLANCLAVSAAEELLPLAPAQRRSIAERAASEGWDIPQVRNAVRKRVAAKQRRTGGGILTYARGLRGLLPGVSPSSLKDVERRELRQLLTELAVLAKAPTEPRAAVLPAMPKQRSARVASRSR